MAIRFLRASTLGIALTFAAPSGAESAHVEVPSAAHEPVVVRDVATSMSARFSARGARPESRRTSRENYVHYTRAFGDADLEQRTLPTGVEDFVFFDTRPAREELVYDVDVSQAAGLRLVSGVLEMLDAGGAPRLRIVPPWVEDAHGRHDAALAIVGCEYDDDPRAPWGREVTAPGRDTCEVHVSWHDVTYPAVVDPEWSTTANTAIPRIGVLAILLSTGKTLILGGTASLVCELFDPVTKTFAATGALKDAATLGTMVTLASKKLLLLTSGTPELYDPATGTFSYTSGTPVIPASQYVINTLPLLTGKVIFVVSGGPSFLYDPVALSSATTGMTIDPHPGGRATVLKNGKILATGTVYGGGIAELYDPANGTWTQIADMKYGRGTHATLVLADGKVLLAGGRAGGTTLNVAELYDPVANTFTATGSMAASRADGPDALLLGSGKVLVYGGNDNGGGQARKTGEIFDPATGQFTLAPTPPLGLGSGVTVDAGHALVFGGNAAGMSQGQLFTSLLAGMACSRGSECDGGICVDGVCCNSLCAGQCEACDVPGKLGTCSPVKGAVHAKRTACPAAGDPRCDGRCDGTARDHCSFPAAETECATACSNARTSVTTCDGTGACAATGAASACPNGLACASGLACLAKCKTSADCVAGLACQPDGKCGSSLFCSDTHTSQAPSAAPVECAPYSCGTDGRCKMACSTVDDCVAPATCDPSGACVASASDDGGGCSSTGQGSSNDVLLVLGAIAAIVAARGRSKRVGREVR